MNIVHTVHWRGHHSSQKFIAEVAWCPGIRSIDSIVDNIIVILYTMCTPRSKVGSPFKMEPKKRRPQCMKFLASALEKGVSSPPQKSPVKQKHLRPRKRASIPIAGINLWLKSYLSIPIGYKKVPDDDDVSKLVKVVVHDALPSCNSHKNICRVCSKKSRKLSKQMVAIASSGTTMCVLG